MWTFFVVYPKIRTSDASIGASVIKEAIYRKALEISSHASEIKAIMKTQKVWFRFIAQIVLTLLLLNSAHSEEYRVGALLPLTGDFSALGGEIRRGLELAQVERGEQKPRVRLIIEDMQSLSNRVAVSAAHKLLSVESVDLGLSCFASETVAIAPVFQSRGVPVMVLWDSTQQILGQGSLVFSNGFSTEAAGEKAAEFTFNTLHAARVALISHIDAWASAWTAGFLARFRVLGGTVAMHNEVAVDTNDFRPAITKARSIQFDALVLPLATNIPLFLKQVRANHINLPMITADGIIVPGEISAAGKAADGLHYIAAVIRDEDSLSDLYQRRYGTTPQHLGSVAFGYDGMQVVYNALKLRDSGKISISRALEQVLGPDRSADREVGVFKIIDGKSERIG